MHCEIFGVGVIIGECFRKFLCKSIRAELDRECLQKPNDFVPMKEVASLVIVKMCPTLTNMLLEGLDKMLHCGSLGIGTNAPRMRCLMMIPGSEIIGALRKDAPFPLSSSLDSHPTVESYFVGVSLILIRNAPLAFCFTDGERESFGCFLFSEGAVENARESFSVV